MVSLAVTNARPTSDATSQTPSACFLMSPSGGRPAGPACISLPPGAAGYSGLSGWTPPVAARSGSRLPRDGGAADASQASRSGAPRRARRRRAGAGEGEALAARRARRAGAARHAGVLRSGDGGRGREGRPGRPRQGLRRTPRGRARRGRRGHALRHRVQHQGLHLHRDLDPRRGRQARLGRSGHEAPARLPDVRPLGDPRADAARPRDAPRRAGAGAGRPHVVAGHGLHAPRDRAGPAPAQAGVEPAQPLRVQQRHVRGGGRGGDAGRGPQLGRLPAHAHLRAARDVAHQHQRRAPRP